MFHFLSTGFLSPSEAPLFGRIGIKNVREIYANGSKLSLDVSYAGVFAVAAP